MKTILVIGPIGSGKTTLAGNLFRSGKLPGKCAFIFNDDGTPETVDAAIIAGRADFRPMNSGCFGCRDVSEFKSLLKKLTDSGEYAFTVVEPLGFVEGSEVPRVLGECGINPRVICLLDVKHLRQNDALGIVPSQLRAGHVIALTKYPEGATLTDRSLEKALDYVGHHAPGKQVVLLPPYGSIPDEIIRFISDDLEPAHSRDHCSCGHHHDHSDHKNEHDHEHHDDDEHHHDHGFFTYSFLLKPGVGLQTVKTWLESAGDKIVRVKGTAEGRQFHVVHGDWQVTIPDDSQPFLTFYSTAPVVTAHLAEIVRPTVENSGTTKTLVRSDAIPPEQTIQLIKTILDSLPKEAMIGMDGPITNPELHELLNEVRKRPGVPPTLNAKAIRARVDYYLKVSAVLNPESKWWLHPNSGRKKYDLAVGIGWFAQNKPKELGWTLRRKTAKAPLALLLTEGLLAFQSHNPDQKIAVEMASEVRDVVRFIGSGKNNSLETAIAHCVTLAQDREADLLSAWQETLKVLRDQ